MKMQSTANAFLLIASFVSALADMEDRTLRVEECPLWTFHLNGTVGCTCANDLKGTVKCDSIRGAYSLSKCFCMTASHGDTHLPTVGACMFYCDIIYPTWYYLAANTTPDDIDEKTCGLYNRTGVMCSKCIEGHGLPVYSYSVACQECNDYHYNWLKYIAVAYLPLTAFYFLVIALRISATSGSVIGYVAICQVATVRTFAILMFNMSRDKVHMYAKYFITFLSIWNLDFFRAFYSPFCIHPQLTALQVLSLDYIVAVFPMVLVLLTFLFVQLHNRYPFLGWLCKPFHKCLHFFRKEWYINNSLIESFATFYLLSYVKILNVSVDILAPTHTYNMDGERSKIMYVYNNASLPYFGKEHLPYAVIAITVSFLFNVLPLLLLFFYPFPIFHICLNRMQCKPQALHIFMDCILGSYKQERRYFGTVYLLFRIVSLSTLAALVPLMYIGALTFYLFVTITSLALLTPYKERWHNVIDIVLTFTALTGCSMMVFYREGMMVAPAEAEPLRHGIYNPIGYLALAIVPLYGLALYVWRVLPAKCIMAQVKKLIAWARSHFVKKIEDFEASLPYRVKQEEERPLLKQGV